MMFIKLLENKNVVSFSICYSIGSALMIEAAT